MPGARAPCELLPRGGWATGDAAAQNGYDIRMFWQVWKVFNLIT